MRSRSGSKKIGVVLAWILMCSKPAPAQSNAATWVGVVNFQGSPVTAVASYLATLTGQPVLMNQNVAGVIDCEQHNVSVEQSLKGLEVALRAKGCFLVDIDHRYFKLVSADQTNQPNDVTHIHIDIGENGFTVDDELVTLEHFVEAIRQRASPETEVWIHEADPGTWQRLRLGTNVTFDVLLPYLADAGVRWNKVFREYLSTKPTRRKLLPK